MTVKDSNQNTREHPIDRNLRRLHLVSFTVLAIAFFAVAFAAVKRGLENAHVIYDGRTPEENYSFFLSECAKANFDREQCVFLGRVGRVSGRPPLEEGESHEDRF